MEGGPLFNSGVLGSNFLWWIGQIADDSYWRDNIIPGNFKLRAGDLLYCEFPELTADPNTDVNQKSGGIYMISSLCHNLTPRDTYTSLTLVRDTFGRKPFKSD